MLFRGPMPAVEVLVNGKGPFLFAIDTGAQGEARVDSSLVETLGLKQTGTAQASDGSGRNARELATVDLASIEIGGFVAHDVTAITRNYNGAPNVPKIDGILGFNLFADGLLTLDFPAKRVRFQKGALPEPDGASVLSFDAERGIPVVDLTVGRQKVRAHIDTGNMGGFMLPEAVVEKMTLDSEPRVLGRARTVVGEFEIKEARLKESIKIGRYDYPNPSVVFPAVSDEANIGSRVLADYAVTFDQANRRVRFVRGAPAAA